MWIVVVLVGFVPRRVSVVHSAAYGGFLGLFSRLKTSYWHCGDEQRRRVERLAVRMYRVSKGRLAPVSDDVSEAPDSEDVNIPYRLFPMLSFKDASLLQLDSNNMYPCNSRNSGE